MKERFKSPVVWAAVLAQVAIIIALFMPEISDEFKTISACVVEILTLFGILNNPTDKDNF